jgi:UDP-N-acetylmuramate--alanine ligase
MVTLENIKQIYFIGIGGIGMSALARFFLARGVQVAGYDKTETALSAQLASEGMSIHYVDDVSLLNKNADAIIYTPAIPKDHQELNYCFDNNLNIMKRSDMLQIISKSMNAICIAGTHGKTTVSTMVAHILRDTQFGCNAFLGGISVNYNSNYWGSENNTAVIEADEYDRSFLKLHPNTTVVTAMDADHLDIYGTEAAMQESYLQFINVTEGALIYKHGLARRKDFTVAIQYSYSLQNDMANFYASNIKMKNGVYTFDFCYNGEVLAPMALNVGGMHNVENMIAACAVAYLHKINIEKIASAVANYKGVKRRFEYILHEPKIVYVDDYAHHPEELRALIKSAKALFPNKKCTVAFQPHLFTRTRDFVQGFADTLSLADEVILLDIYPARELPIEGVTSKMIMDLMNQTNCSIQSKEGLLEFVQAAPIELMITAGAGDIDKLIAPIKIILTQKYLQA